MSQFSLDEEYDGVFRNEANYIIKDLSFICTCPACPEQYDVKTKKGEQIGYVRLRGGHLYCVTPDVGGVVVYQHQFDDGWVGCFDGEEERMLHLNRIADCLIEKLGG